MACKNPKLDKWELKKPSFYTQSTKWWDGKIDGLWDKMEAFIQKGGEVKGLNGFIVPKEVLEFSEYMQDFNSDLAQTHDNANKIGNFLRDELSDDESVALTRALGGDGEIPEQLKEIYERFRTVIDKNAQKLIDLGALKEKNAIKDYLKRYYKDYLDQKGGFKIALGKFYKRKEMSLEERLEIGLLENADFVISHTVLEQNKQILRAKLLKQISDNFSKDEATAPRDWIRVSDQTIGGGINKWGALAGRYVSPALHRELNDVQTMSQVLGYAEDVLRPWYSTVAHLKVNVTVKNPATHIYNVASNINLAFLNGDLGHLAKVIKMSIVDNEKFKKLVKMAKEFGLNSDMADMESLHKYIDIEKEINNDASLIKILFKNAYMSEDSAFGKFARNAYRIEDEIFKLASFYRRIEGKKMEKAQARLHFKEAMKDYVDYRTPLPSVVRGLDRGGVFPFMHYIWKSTPRVAKIILKNPAKFALLQVALLSINGSMFADDDELERPEWAEDKLNLFGAKSWMSIAPDTYLNIGRAMPGMKMGWIEFDLGFVGAISKIVSGVDPLWKGKAISPEQTPKPIQYLHRFEKLGENYLPPMTLGRYAQRAVKKATGVVEVKNAYDEEMSWTEFVARPFGVRRFNSSKEILSHARDVIKQYKRHQITREEMNDEINMMRGYAQERGVRFDFKKLNRSLNHKSVDEVEDSDWWKEYIAK